MKKGKIDIPEQKIVDFCRKNHIKKLSLFGSCLTDNFSKESDVDILVEFENEHIPGFFKFVIIEQELSLIFNNRKIDLRTVNDLSRYFRNDVCKQAEVIYNEQ